MAEREHLIRLKGYSGSHENLGREIMRLRYDATLAVIHGMALEAYDQMQNDAVHERKTLAKLLWAVYIALASARKALQLCWSLSRPHMRREIKKRSEIKSGQIHGY